MALYFNKLKLDSVLICDDHLTMIEGLSKVISDHALFYPIYKNSTLEDALVTIKEKSPNFLIVDLNLGKNTGYDLIVEARKCNPKILICVFSAYQDDVFISKAKNCGANTFVSKHCKPEEIISAIKKTNHETFQKVIVENSVSEIFLDSDKSFSKRVALSNQEKKIIRMVLQSKTSIEIAEELSLSRFTIDTHRKNISRKLGISGLLNLQEFAKKHNII